jgi:hypothetical protein
MVATLVGLELERSRSPEWATEEAAGDFVQALLDRKITDRGDIEARAAELGTDLGGGAGVLIARVVPHVAQTGEWRSRVLAIALRAVRAISPGALGGEGNQQAEGAEVIAIVPAECMPRTPYTGFEPIRTQAAERRPSEAINSGVSQSRSPWTRWTHRAGQEALLAANVAEAEGARVLAFEHTGYRSCSGDERGPARGALSETVGLWSRTTSSTDRPGGRWRPIWRTTGMSPPRPSSSTRTATPSATG